MNLLRQDKYLEQLFQCHDAYSCNFWRVGSRCQTNPASRLAHRLSLLLLQAAKLRRSHVGQLMTWSCRRKFQGLGHPGSSCSGLTSQHWTTRLWAACQSTVQPLQRGADEVAGVAVPSVKMNQLPDPLPFLAEVFKSQIIT